MNLFLSLGDKDEEPASKLVVLVPFLLRSSILRQGYGGWSKLCRTHGSRLVRRVCRQCGPKSHDFGYDRNDVNGSGSPETLEQCLGFWYIRQCGPKSHDFGYDRNDVNGSGKS
jgi:hypothetical protein